MSYKHATDEINILRNLLRTQRVNNLLYGYDSLSDTNINRITCLFSESTNIPYTGVGDTGATGVGDTGATGVGVTGATGDTEATASRYSTCSTGFMEDICGIDDIELTELTDSSESPITPK